MSKKQRKLRKPSTPKRTAVRLDNLKEITASTGVVVKLSAVSPILIQRITESYEAEVPQPKKPQYEADAGGDKVWLDHDETTLTTKKEKKAWLEWQEEETDWQTELRLRVLRALVLRGMDFDYEADGPWVEDQELLGIKVPEDKVERIVHYFETEVIGSANDLTYLMGAVMQLSDIDTEALAAAESVFPAQIRQEGS